MYDKESNVKILQVVTQMEAAGAQRVAYLLHQQFKERGYQSHLVFLYVKRSAYASLPGVSDLCKSKPSLLGYLLIAFHLLSLIWTQKPDVVITHTHYSNILGQVVARICGVKCRIAVNHSLDTLYPRGARFIDKVIGASGTYSQIVAVSPSVADALRNYPKDYLRRIQVIQNGVCVTSQTTDKSATREQWSLPTDVPVLVMVGRLSRMKNQAFLINLLPSLSSAHLAIVGEGEDRQALVAMVHEHGLDDRVHFLGELPAEMVHKIVSACDLFLFPSTTGEAMPMALLEAMLLERAIIASDIAACVDVVGQDAICLSVSDPSLWVGAIETLLSHPDHVAALGQCAKSRATAFTPERMTDNYLALIRELTCSLESRGICA